jgi:uncharacterized membrane protein YbhN (UPF0104 family)
MRRQADLAPPLRSTPRLVWRRLLGVLLALAALLYLGALVVDDADAFLAVLSGSSPSQILMALLAAIAMLLLKAWYHTLICERISGQTNLVGSVLPAYCAAQVVRYLPGKIWGLVYQANRLSERLHPGEVVTANAVQTLTTNLLAVGVIGSVLSAVFLDAVWPLFGIVLAVAFTEALHRNPVIERKLRGLIERWARRLPAAPAAIPAWPRTGTLLLCAEWVAYFAIWLALVGDQVPVLETIVLATWYAAASLLAIAVIVVPGGLAVREAIFVALASSTAVGAAALVALAAALRLLLTLAEACCVPIAEGLGSYLSRRQR